VGSAKVAEKILGPTAEYIGDGLKLFTQKSVRCVAKIFRNAEKKLGEKIDEPGAVPPKVLKAILQDGAFCDDDLSVEYFGGVLASSRSEISRDDRGASFLSLVSRLTSYQLRSHYVIYDSIKRVFSGREISPTDTGGRMQLEVFFAIRAYSRGMELTDKEDLDSLLPHVLFGLAKENLIDQGFAYGDADSIKERYSRADQGGFLVRPSALGVELFCWAHGKGDVRISDFLKPEVRFVPQAKLAEYTGAEPTSS